jgi:hypothetical protein
MDGYRSIGTLVVGGKDAFKKGEIIANAIIKKCSFPPTTNVPIDLYPSINVAEFL